MIAPYQLLKAARVLLGMSTAELAEIADIANRSLVRLEAGEPVRVRTHRRVQKALENQGIWFVGETDELGPGMHVQKPFVRAVIRSR